MTPGDVIAGRVDREEDRPWGRTRVDAGVDAVCDLFFEVEGETNGSGCLTSPIQWTFGRSRPSVYWSYPV